MKIKSFGVIAALALAIGYVSFMSNVSAQDGKPENQASPTATNGGAQGFPDLVAGLKAIDGVLGVEAARTSSGKNVIFAWFENKAAAKRWYYSDMHRGVMENFAGMAPEAITPMEGIADDIPILCIASVTPATKDTPGKDGAPFSQISIELYTTLPGGISFGGSFSPETLKVKGMERY